MEQSNLSPEIENKNEVNQESVEKIAKVLESFSPNPDVVILEEAVTSPSRLAELYDKSTTSVKAILGAMLFAVTVQASAGQESQSTEKVESELSFSQTMEMKEKIKEITGIDIVAEAKKVNREVKLYTPEKPATMTIVNLGQTHILNQENNWKYRNEISESQKEIAKFLTSTTTSEIKVFVENFLEKPEEDSRLMSNFMQMANSFDQVWDIYNNKYPNLDIDIKNKITVEKLLSMGFTESRPLEYKKDNKIIALLTGNIFPKTHRFEVSGDIELNMKNSTEYLYANGSIDFEPAEDIDVRKNQETISLKIKDKLKRINEIFSNTFINDTNGGFIGVNKLKSMKGSTIINATASHALSDFGIESQPVYFIKKIAESSDCRTNKECQQLTEEIIKKDIPELKKSIFEDREDVAIELIAKNSGEQKVTHLVYGSAHDFTRAVKKWNDAHPEQQFNLVTVKSQKYF